MTETSQNLRWVETLYSASPRASKRKVVHVDDGIAHGKAKHMKKIDTGTSFICLLTTRDVNAITLNERDP